MCTEMIASFRRSRRLFEISSGTASVRYYEDFSEGKTYELGPYEMTESEIIEFARNYDPQPFHVDPEVAKETPYGGLIASGWHTGSVCMRMVVDGILHDTAIMSSPGMSEVSWRAPVRPGDRLWLTVEVTGTRRSESREAYGLVETSWEAANGDGDTVLTLDTAWFIERRGE